MSHQQDNTGKALLQLISKTFTQEEVSKEEIGDSPPLVVKGYKVGIIGAMQSGKSLLSLTLGQDLVEGEPLLGYFPWDTPWRVLYYNFELPEAEAKIRFQLFGN